MKFDHNHQLFTAKNYKLFSTTLDATSTMLFRTEKHDCGLTQAEQYCSALLTTGNNAIFNNLGQVYEIQNTCQRLYVDNVLPNNCCVKAAQ